MRILSILLFIFPLLTNAQTVTILPTDAMISSDAEFVSLGDASYAIVSPNRYSEESLAAVRFRAEPGHAISLHLHYDTDEYFFVVDGSLTMTIRDSTFVAQPGTFIHVPAGTPHAHGNESDERMEILALYKPGKMIGLFRAWGNLVASGITDPNTLRKQLLELPDDFDVEFIER